MKKILLSITVIGFLFAGCNSGEEATETAAPEVSTESVTNNNTAQEGAVDPGPLAGITFDKYEHDFGQIPEGETVEHKFVFTNTGDNDLILSDARGSCGCTVPQWPREPIKPGEKGEILVSFNSKGRSGVQRKSVTITANTEPSVTTINLTSEVVGGPAQ